MADTLKLEIATPTGTAYSQDVDMVVLSGVEGRMGILPHHVHLVTQLVPGELIVRKDGNEEVLAVGEGLVEITGKSVNIVTNMAIPARDIVETEVEEARQRAAARLLEHLSSEEVASVNASLVRSLAQLRVKRRHHN
jgi:F-type H+-transporting ATPase subunit epsilon